MTVEHEVDEECKRCGQTLDSMDLDNDCSPPIKLTVSAREFATILCALRAIQRTKARERCQYHFTEHTALDNPEIDDLCERLNS